MIHGTVSIVTRNPETPQGPEGSGFAPITRKGRVGEVSAWCIAVIAWSISYGTQVALAVQHGFHGWSDAEAYAEGLLADLASLSMMCLALDQAERGRPAKLTWGLSILAALFMEWANVTYAIGDPEAVILHAWPPFLAVVTVFVLVHIRRTNAATTPPPFRPGPDLPPEPAAPLPPHAHVELPSVVSVETGVPNGRSHVTLAEARKEYRRLAARGSVSGAALGRALGVSDVSGRNWKRKVEAAAKPAPPFRLSEGVAA